LNIIKLHSTEGVSKLSAPLFMLPPQFVLKLESSLGSLHVFRANLICEQQLFVFLVTDTQSAVTKPPVSYSVQLWIV